MVSFWIRDTWWRGWRTARRFSENDFSPIFYPMSRFWEAPEAIKKDLVACAITFPTWSSSSKAKKLRKAYEKCWLQSLHGRTGHGCTASAVHRCSVICRRHLYSCVLLCTLAYYCVFLSVVCSSCVLLQMIVCSCVLLFIIVAQRRLSVL